MYDYWPCDIVTVHDGDTIRFQIDLGLETYRRVWIRLKNVYCPELKDRGGPEAQRAVEQCMMGKQWRIRTFKIGKTDKEAMSFIRYIGVVTSVDLGFSLNDWIITEGYGRATDDSPE